MKNNDTSAHLIPPHGGYSKLVTYKLGLLIYDATAAFCEHYFDRASQEELLEDYRTFLRQRNLPLWDAQSARAQTVRQARPENLTQLRQLMALLVSDLSDKSDKSDKNAVKQEVAANTMICLINQETFLLARQISRLAADFEKDGGITERLYRIRSERRKQPEKK